MMLEHLDEHEAARKLMSAIERTTTNGPHTPDLGGTAKTVDVTKAVRKAILEAAKSGTQKLAPLQPSS
jgi:tartrate dehydrogenase/decarboxylase/D-malate dehydrogenase